MNIVLFSENEGGFFPAGDERVVHICKVLKKKAGDYFFAGIEGGMAGTAQILNINEQGLYFNFAAETDGSLLYPIDMIIGFPRPIQLKRLFRDMASLGVEQLFLTGTVLGEKSYMDSKIVERGTARAALKDGSIQAKSTHIPKLHLYSCLGSCFAENTFGGENDFCIRVCLDTVQAEYSLSEFLASKLEVFRSDPFCSNGRSGIRVQAAVGSERGWTDEERFLFKQAGFTLCSMGQRILRTETAAVAAVVLILQGMGVL